MELNDKTVKIKVEKLRKCFGDLEVLRDISTEIHEGEVVVILGPSGSGKSTFLRCLNKLETTTAGSIVIDGVNISEKKVNMNKVRENIGMVFQHFNLFNNMDVLHNLMLAPTELKKADKKEAKERAMAMLKRVGLAEKADAYPSQLSGGQKQRVAVAVSMICGKDLLVFDEPTSGLDFDSMTQVAGLIRRLSNMGKVIFIVTHDFEFVCRTCSRVLHFDEGEIPDDVLVTMDALPKLRELFSVKVNVSAGDREGGLGRSDGKER